MTEKPASNVICLADLAAVAQTIGWCVGSMVLGAIIFVLSLLVIRSNFGHGGSGSCWLTISWRVVRPLPHIYGSIWSDEWQLSCIATDRYPLAEWGKAAE